MSKVIVITGCSDENSLGFKIVRAIRKREVPDVKIIGISHSSGSFMRSKPDELNEVLDCDLSVSWEIEDLFNQISVDNPKIDQLINCAGMNSSQWFEDITDGEFDDTISVNAGAMYRTSKALLPSISAAKGTILNIVSNASHMPMRCSLAYNASKAAAKMITDQMAHELTRKHDITVFAISPNKLSGTGMSKFVDESIPSLRGWSAEFSKDYQLKALKTGVETNPDTLAEFIAFILSTKQRHFFLSGCDIPYGA